MNFQDLLAKHEQETKDLVWWSPTQQARGEHLENNPAKGERAWSIPKATGGFLHAWIVEHRPKNVLELGTSLGYSTLWIAHALESYGGTLVTLEKQDYKQVIAKKYITEACLDSVVTFYQGMILDIFNQPDFFTHHPLFDFVFMDADRGHYHEYFPVMEPHLEPHTTIMVDNAGNMSGRMQLFLKLLEERGWKYEILDFDNGILVATKQ